MTYSTCDMTHCIWHDSFYAWPLSSGGLGVRVRCVDRELINMTYSTCKMTHRMWHDSFYAWPFSLGSVGVRVLHVDSELIDMTILRVTWLIVCDMTHSISNIFHQGLLEFVCCALAGQPLFLLPDTHTVSQFIRTASQGIHSEWCHMQGVCVCVWVCVMTHSYMWHDSLACMGRN